MQRHEENVNREVRIVRLLVLFWVIAIILAVAFLFGASPASFFKTSTNAAFEHQARKQLGQHDPVHRVSVLDLSLVQLARNPWSPSL